MNTADSKVKKLDMVDLKGQYRKIREAVDEEIRKVLDSGWYVKGPVVGDFECQLAGYLDCHAVIACGNGTDALQIALMALDLEPGDEVIVPAHTYIATAEAVQLLRLVPVLADVDPDTYTLSPEAFESRIGPKTKAVMPVHLYGQSADMDAILSIARKHGLNVIEDNAQAIGAEYTFPDGRKMRTGTMGDVGTTSFYPSKNLGAFGDGGAIFTNDEALGRKIRKIANHGQEKTYHHDLVGVNSRLDSIQAAVLKVKLGYLDDYAEARRDAAAFYDDALAGIGAIELPVRAPYSTHVFHQYTIKVPAEKRDALKARLKERGIPTMIYYPVPIYDQPSFAAYDAAPSDYPVTDTIYRQVLSLPMHTELDRETLEYIVAEIKSFFRS